MMNISENGEEEPRIILCDKSTIYSKLCSVVLIVAMVLHIAALTSGYWVVGYLDGSITWHEGLWNSCFKRQKDLWFCGSYVVNHHAHAVPGWFKACQSVAVIGLLLAFPAFYIVKLYALLPRLGGKKLAYFIATGLSLAAGIFILLGPIVFAASYPPLQTNKDMTVRFHWSFGFEIIAAILCFVSVGLEITEMHKSMLLF